MSVRRLLPWALMAAAVVVALVLATRPGDAPASPEARAERLSSQLRCPVCQGLSVADSPSSTARAIADDVRRRVDAGQTDDEIKRAYVERYGEWVLLRPRSDGVAAVVWALPVVALVGAGVGLAFAFRRWSRQPSMHATEADRRLVEEARVSAPGDDENGAAT
ncbi:MAG TPA: cytochrome c-type biogenesis protein [Acidimicrobiia bacterium]|nr:cytochrome c-type biogenesis protein [Acidimicrobiia bacterium]